MENTAALTALVQDPPVQAQAIQQTVQGAPSDGEVVSDPRPVEARKAEPEKKVDDSPQPGDLRLVIEQDGDSGVYVYKTVDRRTGETLKQYPREDVLKFRDSASYGPGAVYDGLS